MGVSSTYSTESKNLFSPIVGKRSVTIERGRGEIRGEVFVELMPTQKHVFLGVDKLTLEPEELKWEKAVLKARKAERERVLGEYLLILEELGIPSPKEIERLARERLWKKLKEYS
ncbi:MAG: hypothetical protein DRJ51_08840 [Thermoprotei archaeon]|nr:MAG: hypothetical protein DRJ51_08840 [Thermoprotei archaeon]RLF02016.1 MAG: hypothetical protein DRJ59_04725 [Thermoprotei archaeon]